MECQFRLSRDRYKLGNSQVATDGVFWQTLRRELHYKHCSLHKIQSFFMKDVNFNMRKWFKYSAN